MATSSFGSARRQHRATWFSVVEAAAVEAAASEDSIAPEATSPSGLDSAFHSGWFEEGRRDLHNGNGHGSKLRVSKFKARFLQQMTT